MSELVSDLLKDLPKNGASQRLLDCWLQARGSQILPRKSVFEELLPADLAFNATIVEVRAPDKLIYVRGSEITKALSGIDRTGANMLDITVPSYRRKRSQSFWTIAYRPCVSKDLLSYPLLEEESGFVNCINLSLPVCPDNDARPMEIYITVEPTDELYSNLLLRSSYPGKDNNPVVSQELSLDFFDIGNGTQPFDIPNVREGGAWPASSRQFEL